MSNLTRKLFVFWKSGHLWEVVAYERWSQREVPLYLPYKRKTSPLFTKLKSKLG